MSDVVVQAPEARVTSRDTVRGGWLAGVLSSPRWSASLVVGIIILGIVLLMAIVGAWFVNPADAIVGAVQPSQRPSAGHLLGTDSQGRDMLTIMVLGTP